MATRDHLPARYFREHEKAFLRAVSVAGGTQDFLIGLAGLKIRVRAAGDALLPCISPTLAHLEIRDDAPADFTICCWDDKATGAAMPRPPRAILDRASYCCLELLTNERFRAFHVEWGRIFSCIDLESGTGYCCYEDAASLLMYEVSGPLRGILNTILNTRGMQMIHASAVGTPGGAVLFAGPPGSGKSTLAVLCLQDGLCYQSDDLCVLTSGERPASLSVYNIAKLREDSLPRFGPLHPMLSFFEEDERKAFFYVHQHFPAQVLKEAPVRALVLPRVTGEPSSRLERARPMEAVRAVISWTLKEMPKAGNAGEKIMLQAVAKLPAYHLDLGADDRHTLALIRSLLP